MNLPQAVSEIPWGHNIVLFQQRDTHKPIGVSEYRLTDALPQELKPSLPTIEELEEELKGMEREDGRTEAAP